MIEQLRYSLFNVPFLQSFGSVFSLPSNYLFKLRMDLDAFKNLLERLQSADHDVRNEAETALTNISHTERLSLLLQSMTDASLAVVVRAFLII